MNNNYGLKCSQCHYFVYWEPKDKSGNTINDCEHMGFCYSLPKIVARNDDNMACVYFDSVNVL